MIPNWLGNSDFTWNSCSQHHAPWHTQQGPSTDNTFCPSASRMENLGAQGLHLQHRAKKSESVFSSWRNDGDFNQPIRIQYWKI